MDNDGSCANPESMTGGGGPTLIRLILKGSEDIKTIKSRQLSASAGGSILAHIDSWFGSFVIFRGFGPVLLGNPINL